MILRDATRFGGYGHASHMVVVVVAWCGVARLKGHYELQKLGYFVLRDIWSI